VDAITLLREDHEKVLAMLTRLETGPTAAMGADADQLRARKDLATELVVAESQHEAVEEQYFWPMVRDSLPGGDELANRAVHQEDDAKQVLHALENSQPGEPIFEESLRRIIADGRKHIEYEQTQVWPKVTAAVSRTRLEELGDKMARAKKVAPTRPHPSTPSDSGTQKTAGPVAAMADKIRDVVTGRGRNE
jgi:hemerythrin-like domain-containing protein